MHFGLRQIAAAISAVALIFCCSCEQHHVGEDPEVQKERLAESKAHEDHRATEKSTHAEGPNQKGASAKERSTSSAPKTSPTPVEFFPETTPSP